MIYTLCDIYANLIYADTLGEMRACAHVPVRHDGVELRQRRIASSNIEIAELWM